MPELLALPPPLIEKILYELPSRDLAVCMFLSKLIFNIIRQSVRLKYKLALMRVGAEDNPFSTLATDIKLKSLLDSQRAWIWLKHALSYGSTMTLPVGAGADVSLGGGMLYGSTLRTGEHDAVNMVQLTTSSEPEPGRPINYSYRRKWRPHASGSSKWLAYTTSLYEHGLLAEVHSEWEGEERDATMFKISMYLHQYERSTAQSTADQTHHIYVMDCPLQQPFISLQIVGKHIVIIVGVPEGDEDVGQDHIFVYDFILDVLVMAFRTPGNTYRSIVFLDENFILLPNIPEGCLDIFRIPSQPKFEPIIPLVSLELPILYPRFAFHSIVCTANPNPISENSYAEMYHRFSQGPEDSLKSTLHPERGHFKRAEDSLCIFTAQVETLQTSLNPRRQLVEEMTFVVHRSELLEIAVEYDEQPLPPNHPHPDSTPPPHPPVDYHGLSMQYPLTTRVQTDFETEHIQWEDESGEAFWNMPSTPYPVPWEDWGPSITRWFSHLNMGQAELTRGWGERCVRMMPRQPRDNYYHGTPVTVVDFCRANRTIAGRAGVPIITRRNARYLSRAVSETVGHPVYGEVVKFRWELIDFLSPNFMIGVEAPTYLINRVFQHPVISTLPYYCGVLEETVDWDRILIDDQMIVGIRPDICFQQAAHEKIGSVEVRFFG